MQSQRSLLRSAAIFAITTSLTWAGAQTTDLPNFLKVDDHVYRGAQPTDSGFKNLADLGIKTIVDLRDIGEHSQADERNMVTGLGMRYVSMPMPGMSTKTEAQIKAVHATLH